MTPKQTHLPTILALTISILAGPIFAEDLVRVDFQMEVEYSGAGGVFGDDLAGMEDMDQFSCEDPDDPEGLTESFDLVDYRDDASACVSSDATPASDGVLSISWGNGRWKVQTGPTYARGVGLNFEDGVWGDASEKAAMCAQLVADEYRVGGEAASGYSEQSCGCGGPCTALATLRVDSVFKRGATRQDVSFPVRRQNGSPALMVDYVNPLYVCPDPLHESDADVRYLQTDSCDGESSVAEAEVLGVIQNAPGETLIGRWNMPLKVRLRKVVNGGTDDGGSGGGTCDLSPKGAVCTANSECCSGKCGGKPGSKTCK